MNPIHVIVCIGFIWALGHWSGLDEIRKSERLCASLDAVLINTPSGPVCARIEIVGKP